MAQEPTLADPLIIMQQQGVQSLVQQVIAFGRAPGGHIRDALGLLEQIIANVVARSGEEAEDEATLADMMAAVLQRIASIRHPQ